MRYKTRLQSRANRLTFSTSPDYPHPDLNT